MFHTLFLYEYAFKYCYTFSLVFCQVYLPTFPCFLGVFRHFSHPFIAFYQSSPELLFQALLIWHLHPLKKCLLHHNRILLLALFLLLGLLGREGYMHKKYPMIDLMSGVNLSGDFFQRSDLFWSGSLLFCLFYLCGSIFFYQHELLKRCRLERGTWIVYASVVLFSVFAGKLGFSFETYRTLVRYGYGIVFPVLILAAGIWYKRRKMGRREQIHEENTDK